jgi:hypothetical protein
MNGDLSIGTLNLSLPPGFEARAPHIARHVTQHLGQIFLSEWPAEKGMVVSSLDVRRVAAHHSESDGVIGRRIAHQIHETLWREEARP